MDTHLPVQLPAHLRDLLLDAIFTFSKSSGPGGQHVNTTNSQALLRFNIASSTVLTLDEKAILFDKLANRLTSDNDLIITSQQHKHQVQNKADTVKKLRIILREALAPVIERKPTKISKAAVATRRNDKQFSKAKKQSRAGGYDHHNY